MTIPSIDLSGLAPVAPEIGMEPLIAPAVETERPLSLSPSPSPEAVARFQAAMAAPLAENARVDRLLTELAPLTLSPSQRIGQTVEGFAPVEEGRWALRATPPVRPVADGYVEPLQDLGRAEARPSQAARIRADAVLSEGTRCSLPDSPEGMRCSLPDSPEGKRGSVAAQLPQDREEVPDAERLVAAGVAPPVAGVAPVEAPVQTVAEVAPVAAQSARVVPQLMDVFVEAATAVADTLMVSPGLLRGEGAILVQLKPDVLEGSQIRIAVTGQVLDVAFQPATPVLAELLSTHLPELQQQLAVSLPTYHFNVKVAGAVRGAGRKVED